MPVTAARVMTAPAVTVLPSATMAEVASLLAARRIGAVPVCAADGTLLGIVAEGDIIKPFRESVRQRRDWWLGAIAEGEVLHADFLDYLSAGNRCAADVMVRHVIAAEEDTELPALAELMIKHGVRRLPVLRDGRVVGIVSRADLVAAVSRLPRAEG